MSKALDTEGLPPQHPLRKIYAFKKWAKERENPRISISKMQEIARNLNVPDHQKTWFFCDEETDPSSRPPKYITTLECEFPCPSTTFHVEYVPNSPDNPIELVCAKCGNRMDLKWALKRMEKQRLLETVYQE